MLGSSLPQIRNELTSQHDSADERTSLLARPSPGGTRDEQDTDSVATSLPKAPIFALCFCRLCEPIAITVIFPFISQMLENTGVDPSQIGYRAGVIESLFTAAQFITIFSWGRLSDRIGRKPVVLAGLAGLGVSTFAFGLSKTFLMMVIARTSAGLLNGNIGVIKSSLAELTDDTNEARAFGFLPVSWTTGAALGPIIGGYLADPARQYPSVFGSLYFLKQYRYFLPCFAAALATLSAILVGSCCLRETLPKKLKKTTVHNEAEEAEEAGEALSSQSSQATPVREVLTRRVYIVLTSYAVMAYTTMAISSLMPVFLYTPVHLGGVGFSEEQIGKALAVQAIGAALCNLMLFPPLQRRLGTLGLFRAITPLYPIACVFFPLTSYVASHDPQDSSGSFSKTWKVLIIQLLLLSLANMAYTGNMLLINASAPSQSALGTVNGIAESQAALVRTFALASAPALFALTINKHLLGGYAIWIFLSAMGCVLCMTSWLVKDDNAAWRNDVRKASAVVDGRRAEEEPLS